MSRYDRSYFDRWYRNPRTRVRTRAEVERTVAFCVAMAELVLARRLRTVLDVCCGEGTWQPVLHRIRPRARYTGVDVSEYAVARFGRRRHLKLGRFGELGQLGLPGPYDLIVCSGALYYVPASELGPGISALARLLGGVAYLEIFTARDSLTGDVRSIHGRSAATYDRLLATSNLTPIGLHCYVGAEIAPTLAAFERGRALVR